MNVATASVVPAIASTGSVEPTLQSGPRAAPATSPAAATDRAPHEANDHATDPATDRADYAVEVPDWLQTCLLHGGGGVCENYQTQSQTGSSALVCNAFQFAYRLHEGQFRKSGEPYIAHPIAVAGILRDLGGSDAVIAAGFLHDVVEDTEVSSAEIEQCFGSEVRHLVEGVTKLSQFNFSNKTEQQAENFRRMFLAMAQDIRVILVKLADRLHNMRTLEHMPEEKRRIKAQETRDIFAPLANRLGIGRLKWELEDLSFKYLEPESYREIQSLVAEKRAAREEQLRSSIQMVRDRLNQAGISIADISGRPKHLYSIYSKMERQHKAFHEIYDIAALRIIVQSNEECYRALAIVHDLFRPIPGRFKDYIGLPKSNYYQSLHTSVIGLSKRPLEVQIRTLEMHHVAEYGIAAHWKYKETGGSQAQMNTDDEKFTWLRHLLEWQSDLKDAEEYLESVKNNLFDEDVFIFTPQGDLVSLSQGATSVDFAYRIHSEVGNHCAGAKVNGRIVPLNTQLQNGDIVEIITSKNAHPSMDWMNFVVSSGAKNRIRNWFKKSHREDNLMRGREMLERELGKRGFEALLKSDPMQRVAERCNYLTVDDLLAGLGHGGVTLNALVNRINEATREQPEVKAQTHQEAIASLSLANPAKDTATDAAPILGVEGLVYSLAKCCCPLPGQSIIGVVALGGQGIRIHRQGCTQILRKLSDTSGEMAIQNRLIPVRWNSIEFNSNNPPTYPVPIQVEAIDRIGLMRDILVRLSDHHINVSNARVSTAANKPAVIDMCIDVCHFDQIQQVCNQLQQMSDVLSVRQVKT
ncbi:MAG: bifunctional (p)ppGpp synthetase/guanosine-3',5'-bis(diphosphate) 3'-pyrophosphohydrolase [Synechococcales cyanobacterium CRU_2_2]|nr:bifunctional (p)ppGpp synthetase/guanosine-3',5'-bis(diphosphate) 3'-pyrophosphohydrolase [Synechococcales cyanobacterium CRU_2_2]